MPPLNTLENVLSHVKKLDNGCWEWIGYKNNLGYAIVNYQGIIWKAHRLLYILLKGPIPRGKQLHHRCLFRGCVNPDCQAALSCIAHKLIHKSLRTHCINNHELTHENTYLTPKGVRICRICQRENSKKWHRRTKSRLLKPS